MLEAQRREMLAHMGLKILTPRFQLPGARPSVPLPDAALAVFADPDIQDTTGDIPPPVVIEAGDAVAAIADSPAPSALFEDLPAARKMPEARAVQESVKYRHCLVRVGELMMLLDQPSLEWHDAARCKVFFAEIYFALTGRKFEYWMHAQFDWPPVKNFPYANDKDMAQQALQVFLQEHAVQPPCRWILVWGETVSQSLWHKTLPAGETEFLSSLPVLVLEHYQEYWKSPHKKALLWQHLQVIEKSLATHA